MIELRGVTKSFGKRRVLDAVSFRIERGECLSLFGPNGCGKSTLLNILCGLESLEQGLLIGARSLGGRIGFVSQDYRASLLPWLNVEQNIVFPLRLKRASAVFVQRRLREVLELLPIDFDLHQRVTTLSGGQAQTVSLLRALIIQPELLILDEPFSALDYVTTVRLRETLMRVTTELRLTTVLVSHDPEEALYLGDRVLFLSSRPTRVIHELALSWTRPRTLDLLATHSFAERKMKAIEIVFGLKHAQAQIRKS